MSNAGLFYNEYGKKITVLSWCLLNLTLLSHALEKLSRIYVLWAVFDLTLCCTLLQMKRVNNWLLLHNWNLSRHPALSSHYWVSQRCLHNANFTVFTKHFLLTIGTLTYRSYPPPRGKQLSYINLCFCNQLTSIFCTCRALSISPVMSFLRFECCINLADSYRYETQHTCVHDLNFHHIWEKPFVKTNQDKLVIISLFTGST